MYFITVPAHIYHNKEISKLTQNLYGLIIGLSSQEGYCYATNKTLAKMLNCSISSVNKGLQQLKNIEVIRIELNELGNSRKIYTIDTQNGIKKVKARKTNFRANASEPDWLDEVIAEVIKNH